MKILKFLRNVITENKAKLSILLFAIVGWYIFSTVDAATTYHDVILSFQEQDTYNYLYQDGDNYKVLSQETPLESCQVTYLHDWWKIALAIISSILTLAFFLIPIAEDGEGDWEFAHCWRLAKVSSVTSYFADKIYYYQYDGRLLLRSEWQADRSDLMDKLRQYENTPETFPIYDGPVAIRRNSKLDILLGKVKS